jgi:ribonuclease P protein component
VTPLVWRIRDRATFAALRQEGHRARVGPVTVVYARSSPDTAARVAYAVGRPVGRAVDRNRLRRRLRAAVRDAAPAAGAYLVAAGRDARDLGFDELRASVATAMRRASHQAAA